MEAQQRGNIKPSHAEAMPIISVPGKLPCAHTHTLTPFSAFCICYIQACSQQLAHKWPTFREAKVRLTGTGLNCCHGRLKGQLLLLSPSYNTDILWSGAVNYLEFGVGIILFHTFINCYFTAFSNAQIESYLHQTASLYQADLCCSC